MSSEVKSERGAWIRILIWIEKNFERVVVSGGLAVFSIVLILQVVMRFVFRLPLSWPEELSRYLLIWVAFIGSSLAVREGRTINIDFLPTIARGWVHKALYWIMHLGFLLFCFVATYQSIGFIAHIAKSGQASPAMGIPMWLVYCAAPLGLSLAALRTVQVLLLAPNDDQPITEDLS